MTESTARAERFERQTSASPCFTWEVPQKPVAVRIPFDLIDRLEQEVVEGFRSLSSRGSEVGGLLLGSVRLERPAVVCVEAYELIPCDYSRGPLYRLSEAELGRFRSALEQRKSGDGPAVIGFFRSHTRKGLGLDADDLAFFQAEFRDAFDVALLVRPFATKASIAGIFIRENGEVRTESSYQEFPFRSSQLKPTSPGTEPVDRGRPSDPGPPPAAAPKPAARAQIVPIAVRREMALPGLADTPVVPEADQAAAARPDQAPKAEPAPPAAASRAVQPGATLVDTNGTAKPAVPAAAASAAAKPAEPPVTASAAIKPPEAPAKAEVTAPTAAAPAKAQATAPVAPVPASAVAAPEPPAPSQERPVRGTLFTAETAEPPAAARLFKSKWLLIGAGAAVLFAVLVFFFYPGLVRRRPPVVHQDSSPLSLRVERTAGEILLTWNRDSDAIRNATHAVLSISDGERQENVQMDLAQLRNGSIVYSPSSSDVSFRMEVTGQDQAKVTSESVRVLRTRPSPMPDPNQPAQPATASAPTAGGTPTTDPNAVAPLPAEAAAAGDAQPKVASTPVKPFSTDSLSERLRPARPTDLPEGPALPEAPSLGGVPNAAPPAVTSINLGSTAPALPAPPGADTKAPAASKSGGQIRPAQLVYKKDPDYPKLARQAGAKGQVELLATIGANGKVKTVNVIRGHAMLARAASEAVMQWVYKPALLNGTPVETQTQIVINFVGTTDR